MSIAPLESLDWLAMALGRQLLYASVVFVVVAVAARLLRRSSPYLLYGLWALVPLRLLAPVDLGWSLGIGELARGAWLSPRVAALRAWLAGTEPTILENPASLFETPTLAPMARPMVEAAGSNVLWPAILLALLTLWSLLAMWVVLRGARARRTARAVLAEAREVPCEIEELRREFGVRRRLCVLSSPRRVSPFTLGTLRPAIFLPEAVLADPELRRAALAHELAHVVRFDDLRGLVLLVVRCLWAPFPPLHLAISRMMIEAERLCDAMAARHSGLGAASYSRALLSSLRLPLEPLAGAPGLHPWSRTARRWKVRLESLNSGGAKRDRTGLRWLERGALLGVAVLLLPMAPVASASGEEEPVRLVSVYVSISPPQEGPASLINPLPGQPVTSSFGHRENPFGEAQTRHHDGIDLRADSDSRVLAPADGRVTLATTAEPGREGMGTALVLDHGGGVETYYAHLESFDVELGEWVRQGEVIAVPGSSGRSTGRHLHFEVWRAGEKVDPASLVPDWQEE